MLGERWFLLRPRPGENPPEPDKEKRTGTAVYSVMVVSAAATASLLADSVAPGALVLALGLFTGVAARHDSPAAWRVASGAYVGAVPLGAVVLGASSRGEAWFAPIALVLGIGATHLYSVARNRDAFPKLHVLMVASALAVVPALEAALRSAAHSVASTAGPTEHATFLARGRRVLTQYIPPALSTTCRPAGGSRSVASAAGRRLLRSRRTSGA
ncbi:MAG: hypothetical protein M5R36_26605 [Deltaproteobacteria bacterium]|nr:hypothetical protein [Deltaproteobacteria bacterium]